MSNDRLAQYVGWTDDGADAICRLRGRGVQMTEPLTVRCPQCGKTVRWAPESKWRPFCSARCKQLDLGAWASESYHVPGAMPPDSDEPDNRSGND